MGVLAMFKRKESDLLNHAHSIRATALGLFDDLVGDLAYVDGLYEDVKKTAIAEVEVLRQDFEAAVVAHTQRHDDASVAQAQARTVADKVKALLS